MLRQRGLVSWSVAALVLLAGSTRFTYGVEVTLKNDSIQPGANGAIQAGFIAGEAAAVWLEVPCDGNIVAVQVFWRSLLGGAPQSVEDSITIFDTDFNNFPTPGSVLQVLEAPVMTDGVLNEFRFLDENNTIPLMVPVQEGQTIVVSFRFFNNPSPLFGPSVVTDANGCQPNANSIFAIPGGWTNVCAAFPISGDFFIRAVVDCTNTPGACCMNDGTCDDSDEDSCLIAGGDFQGFNSQCSGVICPVLFGACCAPDGNCTPDLTLTECNSAGGQYQGDGSVCAGANCPILIGGCCMPDGSCVDDTTQSECTGMGGQFAGTEIPCGPGVCQQPVAACCFVPVGCLDLTLADCDVASGFWQGFPTTCATIICFPSGACCLPSGACQADVAQEDCLAMGGTFQGDGVLCSGVSCPQPTGACCLSNGNCLPLTAANCGVIPNSSWAGAGTNCADGNMNSTADACEAGCGEAADGDLDNNGSVNGRDLGMFVEGMLGSPTEDEVCAGDFNGSTALDPGDVNGMVSALLGN